jgi:hypothetical protein
MIPQEKAKELFMRNFEITVDDYCAKQCALIAVDEILNLGLHDVGDYRNDQSTSDDFSTVTWYINYWEEVKQEIEQL